MITYIEPKDFKCNFEVTGCYVLLKGKILFLERAETDDDCFGMWGTPGGKLEQELPIENIIREMEEETGLKLEENKFQYLFKAYVTQPPLKFIYHVFLYDLNSHKRNDWKVVLSDEHSSYKWVAPQDSLKFKLVQDEDWCIKKAFGLK